MTIMLILFGGAIALELSVHIFSKWLGLRRVLTVVATAAVSITAVGLCVVRPNLFTVLIALVSVYRGFNLIRVLRARMHEQYLRNATHTSTLTLLGIQAVLFAGWLAWGRWPAEAAIAIVVLSGLQALVGLGLLLSTVRNVKKTAWPTDELQFSDSELPTVTVAIPARNETDDLQACLKSVIASDYPKLEIVVLDDCSQVKRTPQIIKEFAHDGVRFVQGKEPSETWLPKNQAYQRLADEASGRYILFCGVDIRFERQSIRKLMTTMLIRKKQMLCILPKRDPAGVIHPSFVQAMRYWWELVPPRRIFNRPPVLSSCWVIERQALKDAGSFAAVARSIMPEAHFAKALISTDGYSFLRSTGGLEITSSKADSEQRDTAVRMRYPQLHRRPEQVLLLAAAETIFLLLPFMLFIAGFVLDIGLAAQILSAVAAILMGITYELAMTSVRLRTPFSGLGQLFAVVIDVALLHYSMYKYEFSTVDWRGRNVCIPVMHVTPHLPKEE